MKRERIVLCDAFCDGMPWQNSGVGVRYGVLNGVNIDPIICFLTLFNVLNVDVDPGGGGNDNIDIKLDDKYTSKAGGGKLGIDDFELLKVLGKGSFGKVRVLGLGVWEGGFGGDAWCYCYL